MFINVFENGTWTKTNLKTISLGDLLFIKCLSSLKNTITLTFKDRDSNIITVLNRSLDGDLEWKVENVKFSNAGIYQCESTGISELLSIYVYSGKF